MITRMLVLAVFLLPLLARPARADDITLKSGEVLNNVKVLKKTDKTWRLELLDGNKRSIPAADVVSHIEKKTLGDVFDEREEGLGRKDVEGMLELGRWGLENGIDLRAMKLLGKVIRLDKDNAEARKLLGHELCDDGRWRYGSQLETWKKRKEEERLKELGWVRVGGEYVSPYVAKRLEAKLVEHAGDWWKKAEVAKLEKGLFFLEGEWYAEDERARTDAGERKVDGAWADLAALDQRHRDATDPWVVESRHFVLRSTIRRKNISLILAELEKTWPAMVALFEDAPLAADLATKVAIYLDRSQKEYAATVNATKPDPRQDAYASMIGAVCVPRLGVMGYWFNADYTVQWCRHAAVQSFLDQLHGYRNLRSLGYEALGAYFESFGGDRYFPNGVQTKFLRGWDPKDASPFAAFKDFKLDHKAYGSSGQIEDAWARLGFAMHYFATKHPEIFKNWAMRQGKTEETHEALLEAVEKAGGEGLLEDFRGFLKDFQRLHQPPEPLT